MHLLFTRGDAAAFAAEDEAIAKKAPTVAPAPAAAALD